MNIPQSEADALIAMRKRFDGGGGLDVAPGLDYRRRLVSEDGTESFDLDIRTNAWKLTKYRYQNRSRRTIILLRLCVDGPPHTNPDGVLVSGTHLHRYREGFGDKFAEALDVAVFADVSDRVDTLAGFCVMCNIVNVPGIAEVGTLPVP